MESFLHKVREVTSSRSETAGAFVAPPPSLSRSNQRRMYGLPSQLERSPNFRADHRQSQSQCVFNYFKPPFEVFTDHRTQDLRFLGEAMLGRNTRDTNDVHPETIAKYYSGHTGDYTEGDLASRIGDDLDHQIKHQAVEVPVSGNPFTSLGGKDPKREENIFLQTFTMVAEQGIIPAGYGMRPEEWDDGSYPDVEVLRTRKKGGKEMVLKLDNPVWKRRAELWVQGLNVLHHCLHS